MRTILITAFVAAPALAHAEPPSVRRARRHDGRQASLLPLRSRSAARSRPTFAIHGRGIAGEYLSLFGPFGKLHESVRAGADLTSCDTRARICGFAGLEAGYESVHVDDSTPDRAGAIGVVRGGGDIRVLNTVRWRPMIEVVATRQGFGDVEITQAFSIRF